MRRQSGFTLIELLIVVSIIGIIAAIAVPSLQSAMDKARQRRTMADMRVIGTAIENYSIDNNYYPIQTTQGAISGIANNLAPGYVKLVPAVDGWNWPLQYGSTTGGSAYTIRSFGKDGQKNGTGGATSGFDCDIVFQQGVFVAFPQGQQN